MKESELKTARPHRRVGALLGTVAVLGIVACTPSSSDLTTDAAEMASYVCTFVPEMNQAPPPDWAGPGPEASELVAATSAVALLGGVSGYPLEAQEEAFEAAKEIFAGLTNMEDNRIETGIEQLEAACGNTQAGSEAPSPEENVSYACTLASEFDQSELTFQELFVARADTPDSTEQTELTNKAFGAAALLGGMVGWALPDHPDLSEAANGLYAGLSRADAQLSAENLALIVSLCPAD